VINYVENNNKCFKLLLILSDEEYPAIEVEQLVIKGIRLVLNAIGLVLVLRVRIVTQL